MLQQTQVATVVPYYQRFLQRFPDVSSLAAAEIDEVLKYWEGLGYYRRARQLHAAAEQIVERHAGQFPSDFDAVLGLPGVGRYTAGAILSFAEDQRHPIVEANTQRLLSRLVALRQPPQETAATALLWEVAAALLPPGRGSRNLNQATMELGALLCTPQSPDCRACPVRDCCAAHAAGLEREIPGKVKRIRYENRTHWALVVERDERYFLRVCPPDAHWAGMWDFPRFDVTGLSRPDQQVGRQFAETFGWNVTLGDPLGVIRHGVTKYRITLHSYRAAPEAKRAERRGSRAERAGEAASAGWFRLEELEDLALNSSARKIADSLRDRLF
jgi:A/G-specific adenine glycosylase